MSNSKSKLQRKLQETSKTHDTRHVREHAGESHKQSERNDIHEEVAFEERQEVNNLRHTKIKTGQRDHDVTAKQRVQVFAN